MSMRNISGNYYLVRNLSRDNEGTLATTEEEDGSMVRDRFKGFSLRVEVRRPAFITASSAPLRLVIFALERCKQSLIVRYRNYRILPGG